MLQNSYFLAKIGADTAENEQHFAEILPKLATRLAMNALVSVAIRRLRGILACEHGPQRYLLRPMAHGEGEPNLGIPTYSVPVSYKFDKQLLQNILEISPTKFCTSP